MSIGDAAAHASDEESAQVQPSVQGGRLVVMFARFRTALRVSDLRLRSSGFRFIGRLKIAPLTGRGDTHHCGIE